MPLFETNPHTQTDSTSENNTSANQQNNPNQTQKPKSGLMTIIGQCLPFAPLVFEQFTGQKVPQLSGTMADIINALQQLQLTQTQILTQQQSLSQRLIALETNANHHLTTLTQQFQSLRLTHTKEQKQIEYHPPLENQDY